MLQMVESATCNYKYFELKTLTLCGKKHSEGVFMMRKISKYLFFWALGGALYYTFEILFRGFSHWSMYVLGGICFMFFYIQGESMGWQEPVWKQTLRCTVFVTAGEFITGIIVNKWLHYSVWDYSQMPLQVFGQICVPFMIIFSGLSVLGIFLSGYLAFYLYKEVKPSYHIL